MSLHALSVHYATCDSERKEGLVVEPRQQAKERSLISQAFLTTTPIPSRSRIVSANVSGLE